MQHRPQRRMLLAVIVAAVGLSLLAPGLSRAAERRAAKRAAASKQAPVKEANKANSVEQIIVVFKTHFDIGYTGMAKDVVQRYRTSMIEDALKVVDQNRDLPPAQQFVWTIPGWPMHKILEDWSGQTPQRKERVEQALKEGRFVLHGLAFTTHTELLEVEDMVRDMGYSSQIMRKLGLALPGDGKMTDVPEHTWMLATLLRHAGIRFMHIG